MRSWPPCLMVVHWDRSPPNIDEATHGLITRLIDLGEISCHTGDMTRLYAPAGMQAQQLILVGLGELNHFNQSSICRAAGAAAKLLANRQRKRVAFCLDGPWNEKLASDRDQCRVRRLRRTGPVSCRKETATL